MFFDEFIPGEIDKYGFGMTAGNGRFHFIVAFADDDRVRQLCMSRPRDPHRLDGKPVKWFSSEARAIQVFRNHKKACHKCLRAIETLELSLAEEVD